MNLNLQPFQLEGCECRIKFDPVVLQTLLLKEYQKSVHKHRKYLDSRNGNLTISGKFLHIDGGNYALHLMLAFLGKASLTCQVRATLDDKTILDEPFTFKLMTIAWMPPKSQLKLDAKVLAAKSVKKIIGILKSGS